MKIKRIASKLVSVLLASAMLAGGLGTAVPAALFDETMVSSSGSVTFPYVNDNTRRLANDSQEMTLVAPKNGYYGFILVGPDGGTGAGYTRGGRGGVVAAYLWFNAGEAMTLTIGRGGQNAMGGQTVSAWGISGKGGQGNQWGAGGGSYSALWSNAARITNGFLTWAGGGGGNGAFCLGCDGNSGSCTTPSNVNLGGNGGSAYALSAGYLDITSVTLGDDQTSYRGGNGFRGGNQGQAQSAGPYPGASSNLQGGGGTQSQGGAGGGHSSHGIGSAGAAWDKAANGGNAQATYQGTGGGGGGYYGGGAGGGTTNTSTHMGRPMTGGGGGGSSSLASSAFRYAQHPGGLLGIESPFFQFLCGAAGLNAVNTSDVKNLGSAYFDPIRTQATGCGKDGCFIAGYMGETVQTDSIFTPESNVMTLSGTPNQFPVDSFGCEWDPNFFIAANQNRGCNEGDFALIKSRMAKLNIQRVRMMVLPEWFNPSNGVFAIDGNAPGGSPENMRGLFRYLDVCQELGVKVTLTWWGAQTLGGTGWLACPGVTDWISAPNNNEKMVDNIVYLLNYIFSAGYTCVDDVILQNEPSYSFRTGAGTSGNPSYIKYRDYYLALWNRIHLTPGYSWGDRITLVASDDAEDQTWYTNAVNELWAYCGKFNSHCYKYSVSSSSVHTDIQNYTKTRVNHNLTKPNQRPFFYAEFGDGSTTGAYTASSSDTYDRGLFLPVQVINSLKAGSTGSLYWPLHDIYYYDGTPGDADNGGLMSMGLFAYKTDGNWRIRPTYHSWGLICNYVLPGSSVYNITGGPSDVDAVAAKSPAGKWTVLVTNRSSVNKSVKINASAITGTLSYYLYSPSTAWSSSDDIIQASGSVLPAGGVLTVDIPAKSFVLLNSFVPVTNITLTSATTFTVGGSLALTADVTPANATNQTIVWSVKSGGGTLDGNVLRAGTAGTVVVTATIANGTALGVSYTKDFNITVNGAPETTPSAAINYQTEKLTGLVAGASYTVNGTSKTASAAGEIDIEAAWMTGSAVSIVKVGNGTTTVNSAAQSLTIPAKPATPTGLTGLAPTTIGGADGKINNTTAAMEYSADGGVTWTACSATSTTVGAAGSYQVRVKAAAGAFKSAAAAVTVPANNGAPETTPSAAINYQSEKLTGLVAGASYTVNGTAKTASAAGEIDIEAAWMTGSAVSIVKVGNGTTTVNSAAQNLVIPAKPATPTGLTGLAPTTIGGTDGKINSTTAAMEYSADGGVTWAACTATSTTVGAAGSYQVRVKAAAGAFKSAAAAVTVPANNGAPETTPSAAINYQTEKLTGLAAGASYTVNGTSKTASAAGEIDIEAAWMTGSAVSVVKVGNGTTTVNSAAQSLTIPARPATPTGLTGLAPTTIGGTDGKINNTTAAMEYSADGGVTWAACTATGTTVGAAGSYQVRVKAAAGAFRSAATAVTVPANNGAPETTPSAAINYQTEKLTGLAADASYTVNGTSKTASAAGEIDIETAWMTGSAVSIVKVGNGTTTVNSAAQSLTIPAKPATPTGLTGLAPTTIGGADGKINNTTAAMEYSADGGVTWTACTATSTTVGAAGSYQVRVKAAAGAFKSAATAVTVPVPSTYVLNVTAGTGGTVSGTTSGSYTAGTPVSVTAAANGGCHFTGWTVSGTTITGGNSANPAAFSMPAGAVTLTANFAPDSAVKNNVTVSGGAGGGSYLPGAAVTIAATPSSSFFTGQRFREWTGAGVTFANKGSATTTFLMPTSNVTVTAQYDKMIRLWGKTTRWASNFGNWLLCILCFGWIWMWF